MNANIPSGLDGTWKGTNDGGSCCNTQAETVKLTGYIGVAPALPTWAAATDASTPATFSSYSASNVAYTCIANVSATVASAGTSKFGLAAWELDAVPYTSWWCSNGLYKKVIADDTTSTSGVVNVT
jgi:hypothetical protein